MLTAESIKKKFEHLQSSQESVETLSLWCLHHKDHASSIVSVWLQVFKATEKESKRLSLFYVANDVCQKGRKKKGQDYLTVFVPAIKEAILLSRLDSIRKNIERILNIWEERNVFDAAVVKEFRSLLEASKSSPVNSFMTTETQPVTSDTDNEKIINDFNLSRLISETEQYQNNVESLDRLRVMLPSTSLADDGNVKSLLKSRQEGQKFIDDINQTHKKWSDYVDEYDRRLKRHHHLIIALERAQIFYETQLNEAGIVQTAYSKFGAAVKSVREKLNSMQKSGNYVYVQSPKRDAPSPSPLEDPFAAGLGSAAAAPKRDTDKLEAVDMDLDDDVKFSSSNPSRHLAPQEAAIGGMKLATNQSFLNNPPAAVTANGSSFDVGAPKRLKADPRQRNQQPGEATPSFYVENPELPASAGWSAAQIPLPSPASYPSAYDPRLQAHGTTPTALQSPGFFTQPPHQFQMPQHAGFAAGQPPPPPPPGPASTHGNSDHQYPGAARADGFGSVFEYDHGTTAAHAPGAPSIDQGTNFGGSPPGFNKEGDFKHHERKTLLGSFGQGIRPSTNFRYPDDQFSPVYNGPREFAPRGPRFHRGGGRY